MKDDLKNKIIAEVEAELTDLNFKKFFPTAATNLIISAMKIPRNIKALRLISTKKLLNTKCV